MTLPKDPSKIGPYLQRQREAAILQFQNPIACKNSSDAHKKTYENPEARRLNKERNKLRCADPEVRRQMSLCHLNVLLSSGHKIAIGKSIKKRIAEHPEDNVARSIAMKKHYENPVERKKASERTSGANNPNFGKSASRETRLKLCESHTGKCGEKASNWQGGITQLNFQIRNSNQMAEWKRQVFLRDGYICQETGQIGGNLEAHHKISFSILLQMYKITTLSDAIRCPQLWDISNGIILSKKSHRRKHMKANEEF